MAFLPHQGHISYGVLKRRFGLGDTHRTDLKIKIIEAKQLVTGTPSGDIVVLTLLLSWRLSKESHKGRMP